MAHHSLPIKRRADKALDASTKGDRPNDIAAGGDFIHANLSSLVRLLVDLAQQEDRLIDNLSDALASGNSERIQAAATALVAERKSDADPKIAATRSA